MDKSSIVPFWNRLPAFALYPLRGGALATLVGLGLALVLLGWVPFVGLLLWFGACRYAFEVLLATAHGRLEAPEVFSSSDMGLVFRYVALQFVSLAVPLALAASVDPALGLALFIAFLLAQPAAIIGLALTGSLGRALNPELWLSIIARIGWPYLALIGLLLVIQFSAINANGLLKQVLPDVAAEAVSVIITLWALFATFHLMGYLVYQYHESFGFEPNALRDKPGTRFEPDQELLALASSRIQSGEPAAALQLLRAEIRSRAVGLDVHELYRRLLKQGGQSTDLEEHSRQLIHQLLEAKQHRRALQLARECLDQNPTFTALELSQNAQLAEQARFAGQNQLAIDLLKAALHSPLRHADKPGWALLASDLLSRQSGNEDEARQLLVQALETCQDQELRRRIETQLNALGQ